MKVPGFYQEDRVGQLFTPNVRAAMAEGLAMDVNPARDDADRTLLLLVDPQVDFIHVDGSLSVPGAVDDTRRTIEWIFSNLNGITAIAASLDSHFPVQIFYPTWWMGEGGHAPEAFTTITVNDVAQGKWQPLRRPDWSKSYVDALQDRAQKDLMIWPFHTMVGTPGHSITPALYEALMYFRAARDAELRFVLKGTLPQTEHYSLFEPEVKDPDDPRSDLNREFLDWVLSFDRIYIAGQAKSHCVLESLTSVARRYEDQTEVMRKFHILLDCTSSVQHPEIDFDQIAESALHSFASAGMVLSDSSIPIQD